MTKLFFTGFKIGVQAVTVYPLMFFLIMPLFWLKRKEKEKNIVNLPFLY
jgi:hypothetical protein